MSDFSPFCHYLPASSPRYVVFVLQFSCLWGKEVNPTKGNVELLFTLGFLNDPLIKTDRVVSKNFKMMYIDTTMPSIKFLLTFRLFSLFL